MSQIDFFRLKAQLAFVTVAARVFAAVLCCAVAPLFCQGYQTPAAAQQRTATASGVAAGAASSIDVAAKALEGKLMSLERLEWSETIRNTKTGEVKGPSQYWREISQVAVSAQSCEIRMDWKSSSAPEGRSYTRFLEELDEVGVFTEEEAVDRFSGGNRQASTVPVLYVVAAKGVVFNTEIVRVRGRQTANDIADGLRKVVDHCKVIPSVANDGPSLKVTLSFIEEKLNQQGAVNWVDTVRSTVSGNSAPPASMSVEISRVEADPKSCRVGYHFKKISGGKTMEDGDTVLNLRRVEKLSVMRVEDVDKKVFAQQGHPDYEDAASPPIWTLEVDGPAKRVSYFNFPDQDLANRIAKAMLHAVESCGGGSRDPF